MADRVAEGHGMCRLVILPGPGRLGMECWRVAGPAEWQVLTAKIWEVF